MRVLALVWRARWSVEAGCAAGIRWGHVIGTNGTWIGIFIGVAEKCLSELDQKIGASKQH